MNALTFVVYIHISPNGKKYIGLTSKKPEHRWNNGRGYIKNKYFYNAILKYGWDNFQHIIIAENLSKKEACDLEKALIKGCKTTVPEYGYNISLGGESGTYGITYDQDFCKKISARMTGKNNPNYGKKFSNETRKKLSEARKGRWSEKQQIALSVVHMNRRKQIVCLDTGTIYESITSAATETGVSIRGISSVCKGELISAHGLHWAYYTGQSSEELDKLLNDLIQKKDMVYKIRQTWNKGKTYKTGKQKNPCKKRNRKKHECNIISN